MVRNRNKLIELFIGNISNAIAHKVLEKAIENSDILNRYIEEENISLEIAKKYREKINPKDIHLPLKDIDYIKDRIIKKAKSELLTRISKGYNNIDLEIVEEFVDIVLEDMKVK